MNASATAARGGRAVFLGAAFAFALTMIGTTMPTPLLSRALSAWFEQHLDALDGELKPVVVIAHDVRATLQQWVRQQELGLAVVAWQEIAPEFQLQAIAQIRLAKPSARREAETSARAE